MSKDEPVATDPTVEEGSPADKTQIDYSSGRKIPPVLLLVWGAFFIWMIAYVVLYLIPAFPN